MAGTPAIPSIPSLTSIFSTAATLAFQTGMNAKSELDAAKSQWEAEQLEEQGRANALSRMRKKLADQQMQGSNAAIDRMGQII